MRRKITKFIKRTIRLGFIFLLSLICTRFLYGELALKINPEIIQVEREEFFRQSGLYTVSNAGDVFSTPQRYFKGVLNENLNWALAFGAAASMFGNIGVAAGGGATGVYTFPLLMGGKTIGDTYCYDKIKDNIDSILITSSANKLTDNRDGLLIFIPILIFITFFLIVIFKKWIFSIEDLA